MNTEAFEYWPAHTESHSSKFQISFFTVTTSCGIDCRHIRRCWNSWISRVFPLPETLAVARRALCKLHRHTVACAFSGWYTRAQYLRTKRAQAVRAIAFWRLSGLAHHWEAWRVYTWHRQDKANKRHVAAVYARYTALRHGMIAFQQHAQWKRFVGIALTYFSSALTSRVFASWRTAAQRQCRLRQVQHEIAARWQQLLIRSVFWQWQSRAVWSVHAKNKVQAVLCRWRAHTTGAVWRAWREYAEGRLRKREQMAYAIRHWAGNTLQQAFWAWYEVCIAQKDAYSHWCALFLETSPCNVNGHAVFNLGLLHTTCRRT